MMRNELGGDTRFVCFAYEDENERFCFKPGGSAPKLDGFIQGERFRIETESDDECDDEVLTVNVLHHSYNYFVSFIYALTAFNFVMTAI